MKSGTTHDADQARTPIILKCILPIAGFTLCLDDIMILKNRLSMSA